MSDPVYEVRVDPVEYDGRLRVPCNTAALDRDAIRSIGGERELLSRVFRSLREQKRPPYDQVVWIASAGADVYLSITPQRPETLRLLKSIALRFGVEVAAIGGDYLEPRARPRIVHSVDGGTFWLIGTETSVRDAGVGPWRRYRLGSPSLFESRFVDNFAAVEGPDDVPLSRVAVPYRRLGDRWQPIVWRSPSLFDALDHASDLVDPRSNGQAAVWQWGSGKRCYGFTAVRRLGGRESPPTLASVERAEELPRDAVPVALFQGDQVTCFTSEAEHLVRHRWWRLRVEAGGAFADWLSGRPTSFWVENLRLTNFRSFVNFEHDFRRGFNVVIGGGGRGKSSILDACAAALSGTVDALASAPIRPMTPDDVHSTYVRVEDDIRREVEEEGEVKLTMRSDRDEPRALEAAANRSRTKGVAVTSAAWARELRTCAALGAPVDLPVIVYYGASRQSPRSKKGRWSGASTRGGVYESWLAPRLGGDALDVWFERASEDGIVGAGPETFSRALRLAVLAAIPECSHLEWDAATRRVYLELPDGLHEFSRLSDGYRVLVGMLGDLTWRCIRTNPHLSEDASRSSSGLVLIDEIDKHLHPRWQRRIVDGLREAFPELQFIATTHSPFVVQAMEAGEVVNLEPHDTLDYRYEGIEDIAVEVMGAAENGPVPRSLVYRRFEAMSDRYMALVHRLTPPAREMDAIRRELDQLQEVLNSNPAVAAVLRAQRLAQEERT